MRPRLGALLLSIPFAVIACSADAIDQSSDDVGSTYKAGCKAITGLPSYALHGTALLPNGPARGVGRRARREDRRGRDVGSLKLPSGAKIIETNGVIAPGLVDLHNHVAYDFIPFWNAGKRLQNRYQWARTSGVRHGGQDAVQRREERRSHVRGREVRGVSRDRRRHDEHPGLGGLSRARARGCATSTSGTSARTTSARTCCRSRRSRRPTPTRSTRSSRAARRRRSSCTSPRASTTRRARSSTTLSKLGLLKPQLVGDPRDGAHAGAAAASSARRACKLVWSPLSNLALYGQTTNIPAARRGGHHDLARAGLGALGQRERPRRAQGRRSREHGALQRLAHGPASSSRWSTDEPGEDDRRSTTSSARSRSASTRTSSWCAATRRTRTARSSTRSPRTCLLTTVGGQAFYGASDIVSAIGDNRSYVTVDACGESRVLAAQRHDDPDPERPRDALRRHGHVHVSGRDRRDPAVPVRRGARVRVSLT